MTVLRKALFLDRDGTLIRDAHYLKDPEKVEIIEEIGESLLKVCLLYTSDAADE